MVSVQSGKTEDHSEKTENEPEQKEIESDEIFRMIRDIRIIHLFLTKKYYKSIFGVFKHLTKNDKNKEEFRSFVRNNPDLSSKLEKYEKFLTIFSSNSSMFLEEELSVKNFLECDEINYKLSDEINLTANVVKIHIFDFYGIDENSFTITENSFTKDLLRFAFYCRTFSVFEEKLKNYLKKNPNELFSGVIETAIGGTCLNHSMAASYEISGDDLICRIMNPNIGSHFPVIQNRIITFIPSELKLFREFPFDSVIHSLKHMNGGFKKDNRKRLIILISLFILCLIVLIVLIVLLVSENKKTHQENLSGMMK